MDFCCIKQKAVKKGAYPLRPGVQGFYITCDGGRERQASQEAVNVIDSVCIVLKLLFFFPQKTGGMVNVGGNYKVGNRAPSH